MRFLTSFPLLACAGVWVSSEVVPNGGAATFSDPFTFIDKFVEDWKLNHPSLSSAEVADIHNAAQQMKSNLQNPPPPPVQVTVPVSKPTNASLFHPKQASKFSNATGVIQATNSTVEQAFRIVRLAQQESDIRNKDRIDHPRVNSYYDHHGANANKVRALDSNSLFINDTVTAAAAIVAEATAGNTTTIDPSKYVLPPEIESIIYQDEFRSPLSKRSPPNSNSSWWMETIAHEGKVPFGGSQNDGYRVFRSVKDYGAVGDGKADDTDAINKAMSDGGRCGSSCGSSTIKPAIVYFPAGTYRVRQTIAMYYNTQVIGNPNDLPRIVADENFVGLGVLSSDEYTGGNGGADEWYINQNNFLRQVRNLIIDTSKANMKSIAGLHWQVAQATSIYNVQFWGSKDRSKEHIGIFAENGSGGFMGDLVFSEMTIGIRCGNQQFTSHSLTFFGVGIAVDLLWDWGWTWKNIFISNTDTGFRMQGDFIGGSMMLLDSHFVGVNSGISIHTNKVSDLTQFSITLENIRMDSVKTMVMHDSSNTVLAGGSSLIGSWILGRVYDDDNKGGSFFKGKTSALEERESILTMTNGVAKNGYFIRRKPQYQDKSSDFFLNAHFIAKGDGISDDTFALSLAAALSYDQGKALYIPMGSYIITDHVNFPTGSVVVGECWSQLVAKGAAFQDASNPRPLISIGNPGEIGSVEIQDLLLTVQGPTAGTVLMQWNAAEDKQGSAAMWDVHFRIGGAAGSHLQESDCPKLTGSVNPNCIAGSLMLHMTASSSGYLENVWAWVADHELDGGPSQTQIDIYVARGILIESEAGPVWLYGTSSEHSVLYQYMVYEARNVVMSMIQTESPYFLPDPQAPAPFKDFGYFPSDPDFSECDLSNPHCAAAWGLSILSSTNVRVYGAGLYNWFQRYVQPCVDTQDCQQRVVNVMNSGQVWLYNLYTIGTVEMINHDKDKPVLAKDNTNTNQHPFTSVVNAWLLASTGYGSRPDDDNDDDDDEGWGPLPVCDDLYESFEQIEAAYSSSSFDQGCLNEYLAKVWVQNLTSSIKTYDDIIQDDYNSKFAIYHDLVQTQAMTQLYKYMMEDKAAAWHCTEPWPKVCCDKCTSSWPSPDPEYPCNYMDCSGENHGSPTKCSQKKDTPKTCPDYSDENPQTLNWYLDDPEKFNKTLEDKYGIVSDWVEFVNLDVYQVYGCILNQKDESGKNLIKCQQDEDVFWGNYPQIKRDIPLQDPAKIFKAAYDKTKDLLREADVQMDMARLYVGGSWADIANTLAFPAMSMSAAVTSMKNIVKVANQKIEEDRQEGIAAIIGAVLFFVPFVGDALGAGLALLRTILNLAGAFADIGYTMYDAIEHPGNALSDIFGLIFGAAGLKGAFKAASAEFRALKSDKIEAMPKAFVRETYSMKKMQGMCKL